MKLELKIGDAEQKMRGFGPHDPAEFELDLSQPVLRLQAPSGWGKGFLVRTLKRALGLAETPEASRNGDPDVPAVATVTVGDQSVGVILRKQYAAQGDLATFPVAADPLLETCLVDLIGPLEDGPSREKKAQEARIRALLQLLEVDASEQQLKELCGEDIWAERGNWKPNPKHDLPKIILELQKQLRKRARDIRSEADVCAGTIEEKRTEISRLCQQDPNLLEQDLSGLETLLEEATTDMHEHRASARVRAQQEEERAQVSADLPQPVWGPVRGPLEKALALMDLQTAEEADLDAIDEEITAAIHGLAALKREVATYLDTQEILQRKVTGSTQEQVIEAEQIQADLSRRTNEVRLAKAQYSEDSEKKAVLEAEVTKLVTDHKAKMALSRKLKKTGDTLPTKMGELLKGAGLEVFELSSTGSLMLQLYGETVPYAEASLGERLSAAIEAWIAIREKKPSDEKHRLIFLPIGYGDALTEDGWGMLCTMIENRHVAATILVQRTSEEEGLK